MNKLTQTMVTGLMMVLGLTLFHPGTVSASPHSVDMNPGASVNTESSLYDFFDYYEEEDGTLFYLTPEESGRYVFEINDITSDNIDFLRVCNMNNGEEYEWYLGDIDNGTAYAVFHANAGDTQVFRIRPIVYDLNSYYCNLEDGEEPGISLKAALRQIHDGGHTLKSKTTSQKLNQGTTTGSSKTNFTVFCQEEGCPYEVHMSVSADSSVYTGKTITKYPYEFSFSTSGDDREWCNAYSIYSAPNMIKGTHYTLKCAGKDVGTGTLTINIAQELQSYLGKSFKVKSYIYPKKSAISSLTVGKKSLTVKAKTKVASTGAKYYQIGYRLSGKTKWTTVKTTKQSYTISKLTKGKKYQVRIRNYKKVDKTTYYSAWTKVQTSKAVK